MKTTYTKKGFTDRNFGGGADQVHYAKITPKLYYGVLSSGALFKVEVADLINNGKGRTQWVTLSIVDGFTTADEAMDFINNKYFS